MTDKKTEKIFDYRVLKARDDEEQATRWRRAVFDWWFGLDQRKGERAELRRCQNGEVAMKFLGYFRLKYALSGLKVSSRAIASVAHILSFIKPDEALRQETEITADKYFADLMQETKGISYYLGQEAGENSGKPVFSTLRFQRLLQTAAEIEQNDFDVMFRRAIRQLQGKSEVGINPVIVADQIFYRYRTSNSPDLYKGSHKFEYQFAKDYWQQVLEYQKDSQGA